MRGSEPFGILSFFRPAFDAVPLFSATCGQIMGRAFEIELCGVVIGIYIQHILKTVTRFDKFLGKIVSLSLFKVDVSM